MPCSERQRETAIRPRRAASWDCTGSTVPFRKIAPGGAERFRRAHDGAGVARVLQAIEHHHQRVAAEQLIQRPRRRPHQRDHALAGFGAGNALEAARPAARPRCMPAEPRTCAPPRAHRFGRQHGFDLAIAAQRLFQQVEALGHAPALRRSGRRARSPAARPSAADWPRSLIVSAFVHPITIRFRTIRIPHMKRAVWTCGGALTAIAILDRVWLRLGAHRAPIHPRRSAARRRDPGAGRGRISRPAVAGAARAPGPRAGALTGSNWPRAS